MSDRKTDTDERLPRRQFGRAARAGLWALRVAAIVMVGMTVYVFIAGLL